MKLTLKRDLPLMLAGWAAFIVVFNLIVDILYAVLDPRVRYE